MKTLHDKIAVITGAASGIGRALAEACAEAGMHLALSDVDQEGLRQTADQTAKQGVMVATQHVDVRDAEAVDAWAEAVYEQFGGAHLLCNNAGVGNRPGAIWESSLTDWEWVMDVNLMGVVHGLRAFVPRMINQEEAHILNTASIAGLTSNPAMGVYSVSKHGVVTLSETLYYDLQLSGHDHIGVSVLCPAWVRTQIHLAERHHPHPPPDTTPTSPLTAHVQNMIFQAVTQGMDPATLAKKTLAAIQANTFYILTHETHVPYIEARMAAILDRTAPPPFQRRNP